MNSKSKPSWQELQVTFFKFVQHNELSKVRDIFINIRQNPHVYESYLGNTKHAVNLFVQKKSGDTALHILARLGSNYLQLFRYLVEDEGANIEQLNYEGKTAIHDAGQFSNFAIVQYLIERGANVNVVKRADWTPLMLACTKQDVEIVQLLLSSGADLNFVNKDGWNCLHIAAREGNIQIVEMLLNESYKGLDENTKGKLSHANSRNGRRPLHTAVMHGHVAVAQLLMQDCTPVDNINIRDHCGTTPLMDSCRFGHLELLHYLFGLGGDLHEVNRSGQNCLHIAAESGQTEVVKVLVEKYGMDVGKTSEDYAKMTPLHWAAKEGHVQTLKTLLELNANPAVEDGKGRTALDLVKTFGHSAAAKLFLID